MEQEESIYNLIKKDLNLVSKTPLFKSKYSPFIPPTATTFGIKNTSFPGVANVGGDFQWPKGAHPLRTEYSTLGRPGGELKPDPQNFHRKGQQYKSIPTPQRGRSAYSVKKPPVPTKLDTPITGLKSDKNFVISNVIDTVLSPTRKKIRDTPNYLTKKNFGKVPEYLSTIKKNIDAEKKEIAQIQNKLNDNEMRSKKILEDHEIQVIKEGLTKKLVELRKEYGTIAHKQIFDTLVSRTRKETLEKEMEQIEKDLKLISRPNVVVDLRKF